MPIDSSIYFRGQGGPNIVDKAVAGYQTGLKMKELADQREARAKQDKLTNYNNKIVLGGKILQTITDQSSWDKALQDDERLGLGMLKGAPRAYSPDYVNKKIRATMSMADKMAIGNQQIAAIKGGAIMGPDGNFIKDPNYKNPNELDSLFKKINIMSNYKKLMNEGPRYQYKKHADQQKFIEAQDKAGKTYVGDDEYGFPKFVKRPPGRRKLSISESKQLGLFEFGAKAEKQYRESFKKGKADGFNPTSYTDIIDQTRWIAKGLRNKHAVAQDAAKSAWVEGFLRDASGAAIKPDERLDYAEDFFPSRGDSKKVIANKRELRRQKMINAFVSSGETPESAAKRVSKIMGIKPRGKGQVITPETVDPTEVQSSFQKRKQAPKKPKALKGSEIKWKKK